MKNKDKNIGYLIINMDCKRNRTKEELLEAEKFHRRINNIQPEEMQKRFTI